ncbi:hypothetical protein TREAZ_1877 [Leadbettera azotonutricia ZAS-9]|uniref:Uncharacterized protein n=2 Tax=Leadbettera azotonutricia TaxID=150829 RepID=F5YBD3_LEAAZ|nr:hypothetical protein TREAZ_1877 [Leadbettera azotonutricia ZAS-9]
MIYIYHSMDYQMKEKSELLKVFRTLNPDNQAGLLRCAKIAQTAEEAARKAAKGSFARKKKQDPRKRDKC